MRQESPFTNEENWGRQRLSNSPKYMALGLCIVDSQQTITAISYCHSAECFTFILSFDPQDNLYTSNGAW